MRTSLFLAGFAAFLFAAACAPEEGKEVEAILNRQTILSRNGTARQSSATQREERTGGRTILSDSSMFTLADRSVLTAIPDCWKWHATR